MMETKATILMLDGSTEAREFEWPREPGFCRLSETLEPIVRGDIEHVSVLADFEGGSDFRPHDMFVNARGQCENLPRNSLATIIYRRASMLRMPTRDPETLPFIRGTAVLFSRRVWF